MRFVDRYPLIITARKDECRDFWIDKLGFSVGFDSTWFVWLHAEDESASIAFMTPDHPSAPPGPEEFTGQGVTFEMQVDDAESTYRQLISKGLNVNYPLRNELFGQKRFGFRDPSGLWIDVCEQIESAEGYWTKYLQQE